MKKKGLELSINFLVILIMSIVLFGFGLIFLSKIMESSNELITTTVPDSDKINLQSCLNQDNWICLTKNKAKINSGNAGRFSMAVQNKLGEKKEFMVRINFSTAIDEDGNKMEPFPDGILLGLWTFSVTRFTLENNENYMMGIPFEVPTGVQSGQYVFTVYTCIDADGSKLPTSIDKGCFVDASQDFSDLYDSPHKLYITVP